MFPLPESRKIDLVETQHQVLAFLTSDMVITSHIADDLIKLVGPSPLSRGEQGETGGEGSLPNIAARNGLGRLIAIGHVWMR